MKIKVAIWGSNFGIRVPSSGLSTFITYARAANLTVYGHSPSHSLCNLLHYLPTKLSTQDATFKIVKNMRLVLAWSEINLFHRKGKEKDTSYKLICKFEMKLFRCLKLCSFFFLIFNVDGFFYYGLAIFKEQRKVHNEDIFLTVTHSSTGLRLAS